jgi:photosystem II stability/assembly factor-like uncharacterized protein
MTLAAQGGWQEAIESSQNYYDIVDKAERWFAEHGTGRGSGHKQYMRWQKEAIYHISRSGEIEYNPLDYIKIYQQANKTISTNRSTHGLWVDLGPSDYVATESNDGGGIGRVTCTAFHPTNSNIMWIGTPVGGLWKTTDGGDTWTPLTDGFPRIGVGGIVVDQTNPDHINILTGDNASFNCPSIGTLYSTDGGNTWRQPNVPTSGTRPVQLKAHPSFPNMLFAAFRDNGLFKSTDGGVTWTHVIQNRTVWDVEFKPDANATIYAAVADGASCTLMISYDTGDIWGFNGDTDFPTISRRMSIAVSPSQPNNLYALFGGRTGVIGMFRGLFKSTDSGNDFSMQSNTPNILGWRMDGQDSTDQAERDLALIVDPTNDARVFTGAVCMWGSDDSGVTWDRKTWWLRDDPAQPFVHADFQNFYFQGTTMWINNDGGIYKSTDLAQSFTEITSGLSINQIYEIDVYNDLYMAASQDNGINGGPVTNQQAEVLGGGDGVGCTWHWGNDQIQFVSAQSTIYRRQFGSNLPIFQSTIATFLGECTMHTTDSNYLFTIQGTTLWRGNENFVSDWTWVNLGTGSVTGAKPISGYAQSLTNANIMYISMDTILIKTTNLNDAAPTWTEMTHPDSNLVYTDIEVDPANSLRVWVICGGYGSGKKVYKSTNGGTSWTNVTGSLPNIAMRCLRYQAGSNDGIYLGTEIGVYYRNASMSDWIYFGNHLPNVPVNDIEVSDGYVYAGTFGRGLWRSSVYSGCSSTLLLTQQNDPTLNQVGTQVYNASNNILSQRIIPGLIGTNVFYSAGDHTDLYLGFEIKAGAYMEVKVGDCPD